MGGRPGCANAFGRAAAGFVVVLFAAPAAHAGALPSGGVVVAGSATIQQSGSGATTIVQQSKSAIINWQDFSVGAGAGVTFRQPDSTALILNRVTGPSASAINGTLSSNGQVWLINRNGVLFGSGSQINVGGLIATTSDMKDADFLSGQYVFGTPSANPGAAVVNQGSIKAATGGSVLLSAGQVRNEGLIQARLGRVVLGGADAFSVSFDGDNLLRYQITAPVSRTPTDAQGAPATAVVSNSGVISAAGGSVLMTARAARGVVDNVINTSGLIQATSVSVHNGEVVLDAGEDGNVAVSGTVDVSGANTGESGGTITVHANAIAVPDTARLDASGAAGGGSAQIGDAATQSVTVGKAIIAADATAGGKGGTVKIISGGTANIAAAISAKGVLGGGMVETSGQNLNITSDARVDTSASAGANGLWLLDPVNVDIDSALASSITGNLAATNVSITASNDINVNAPMVYTSANSLALLSGHDLNIKANVQNGGTGSILAVAGWDGVTATNILAISGAYGVNGGSIFIGGGGAAALGSRNGATMVGARNLTLSATNGYAQLGYHGADSNAIVTTGRIDVVLSGALAITAGVNDFAQIGHGGHEAIGNLTGDISIAAQGPVSLTGGNAARAYAQIGNGGLQSVGNNGGKVLVASGGDISLDANTLIKAGGAGDALVLAATGNFVNLAGSTALSVTGGGRWLVFLAAPVNNTPGGLSASPFYNRSFDFSADSYLPVTSAGNRFVYALAPVVTVTAASAAKTYGGANPALTATISGGLPGDAAAGVFTGAPTLGTAATATSGVGNYAITAGLGSLSSDFNYSFQLVNGTLRIDPATLSASLTGLVQKIYDGNTTASLSAANLQLTGVLPGDQVTASGVGSYSDKNVGSGKLVSVSGLTLSGAGSGNYLLSPSSLSGAIGTITPMILTASLTGLVQKAYDGTTTASLSAADLQLTGVLAGDQVSLNGPGAASYSNKNAGSGKLVSVGGLILSGADSANYLLSSTSASGAIGTITPVSLTASLTGTVIKIFDGTTVAVLAPANYVLPGAIAGDDVNLNNPAIGSYDSKYLGTGKTVTVTGLALQGADSGNYVLLSPTSSSPIGIITASLITNAIGNSYTSGTGFPSGPGAAPAGGPGGAASDATSSTADGVGSDGTALEIGKSLSGSSSQRGSSVLLDGLLRQYSASPGASNPHGVPPFGQVYSSWGNEAFWQ